MSQKLFFNSRWVDGWQCSPLSCWQTWKAPLGREWTPHCPTRSGLPCLSGGAWERVICVAIDSWHSHVLLPLPSSITSLPFSRCRLFAVPHFLYYFKNYVLSSYRSSPCLQQLNPRLSPLHRIWWRRQSAEDHSSRWELSRVLQLFSCFFS
jgi:hypothetical protein